MNLKANRHTSIDCRSCDGNRARGRCTNTRLHAPRRRTAARPAARPRRPPPPRPGCSSGCAAHLERRPHGLSGFIDGYYSFNSNQPNAIDGRPGQPALQLQRQDRSVRTERGQAHAESRSRSGRRARGLHLRPHQRPDQRRSDQQHGADQLNYIEQAFLSMKPPKAKGFELDFGKFVTSAGAEVIEAKDNWNYSRSLLFVERDSLLALRRAHLDAGVEDRDHRLPAGQRLEQRLQDQRRRHRRVHQRATSSPSTPGTSTTRRPGKRQHDQRLSAT